jgi:hypothetical protein
MKRVVRNIVPICLAVFIVVSMCAGLLYAGVVENESKGCGSYTCGSGNTRVEQKCHRARCKVNVNGNLMGYDRYNYECNVWVRGEVCTEFEKCPKYDW